GPCLLYEWVWNPGIVCYDEISSLVSPGSLIPSSRLATVDLLVFVAVWLLLFAMLGLVGLMFPNVP
ncbi:hypothetical protein L195_g050313, partial [Trifolium pratense]